MRLRSSIWVRFHGTGARIAAAAALSLLLHATLFWLLLPHGAGRPAPDAIPPIEVELVDRPDQQRGEAPTPETAPPETPSAPQAARGDGILPPAPPPMPPRPAPPGPASRPAVNLGGDAQDQDGLLVTGQNIVPPRADSRFRNQPPSYPPQAARRGIQGTVRLIVHVTEVGVPSSVDVAISSGDASLDRAAVEAVALWRFDPARNNGAPVPFDYSLDVNFRR